jgi:hypothetical protein
MMNPVMSHLNLLVRLEAGDQLPPFCLVTQDLPPMLLEGVRVIAGSATPRNTSPPSTQPGTRPSPLPIPVEQLQEIQEGILQHNLKCRDSKAHLNSKRQQLHWVAIRYRLSENLWTAIVLMIPVLLFEADKWVASWCMTALRTN